MPIRWSARSRSSGPAAAAALGIVLVAVNLRPALAGVGPVLDRIRSGLGLTAGQTAVLTALPVLLFGLVAPAAPYLARRLGIETALALALAALTAGLLLRLGPGAGSLFAGTGLVGAGIAVGNVLLPALVKRDFPDRAGPMTGLCTTALNLAAAAAAAATVPVEGLVGHGWRAGLGVWCLPALVAAVVWSRRRGRQAPADRAADGGALRAVLRSRRTWPIVAFTAAQSVIYYAVLAWLPTVFQDHGLSAASSGLLLSVTTVVGAPVALVLPTLAARRTDQSRYVLAVATCSAAGLLGLLAAPTAAPYLWAVLIGLGQGGAFPLALTLVVLRTRDSSTTAALSMLAQSAAYLLASGGPLAMGLLRDRTGSWSVPIAVLLACAAVESVVGLAAARPGRVDAGPAPETLSPLHVHPRSDPHPEEGVSRPCDS